MDFWWSQKLDCEQKKKTKKKLIIIKYLGRELQRELPRTACFNSLIINTFTVCQGSRRIRFHQTPSQSSGAHSKKRVSPADQQSVLDLLHINQVGPRNKWELAGDWRSKCYDLILLQGHELWYRTMVQSDHDCIGLKLCHKPKTV